ncbi:response regulator transcription factor [Luteimonas kalidii]|uniref:Response regulator transcription factor n=1 Tax=Luteimonas kalidii TaxID=3042025 RepID=A0ABT6JWY2_9GAMM|nr:response regulator transcription factor [Luteimonas kalidii]MDH5835097.1 response regulator transcription factor [Luteimonas kalidii]
MAGDSGMPMERRRLAVVEDDAELREQLMLPALRRAGFDVTGLESALQFYRLWAGAPFDLVLLDVGLPDDDGVEVARHLRGLSPDLGIVLCTGHGRGADRLRGLRAGVDAYLVKPLDMEEVVETVRNVHRRLAGGESSADGAAGGWRLDRQGWSLRAPSGVSVDLNHAERQIVGVLATRPNQPVSRETLIRHLTGDVDGFDPHRLEMLVYRLRRKCQDAAGEPLPLKAVRGLGYVLER